MIAIVAPTPGGPEALVAETRPLPTLGAGRNSRARRAAGVNRADLMQRAGHYPPPPGASDILGLEIAGEVVARGTRRHRASSGRRPRDGAGAGRRLRRILRGRRRQRACPFPADFHSSRRRAIPETFFTVWPNLFDRGRLTAGETALIHGGASGIGTTAIQLAKAFGARVIVTAGSDERCAACLKLGADVAINYRTQDFVAAAQGGDRRARRRRHPRHRRRRLRRPQLRGRGRGRAHRPDRDPEGRARRGDFAC